MPNLKSSLLNQINKIEHGFGTQEEPIIKSHIEQWKNERPLFKQVHGTQCIEITQANQNCGDADGFYTSQTQLPVGVFTADCVPILLAKKDGTSIAALHAGWRGTYHSIIDAFVEKIGLKNDHPKNWVAAVGPSIGACCYEVSSELISDFKLKFQRLLPTHEIEPSPRKLNLSRINQAILQKNRFLEVEILSICTFCTYSKDTNTNPLLFSYRRGSKIERQLSSIKIISL